MWMCIKQDDEGKRGPDVSFGDDAKEAYETYRSYHDEDVAPEDMYFYELPKTQTATVTWNLS